MRRETKPAPNMRVYVQCACTRASVHLAMHQPHTCLLICKRAPRGLRPCMRSLAPLLPEYICASYLAREHVRGNIKRHAVLCNACGHTYEEGILQDA
eukprot:6201334-Pleurochrysis_carterae.AAC.2